MPKNCLSVISRTSAKVKVKGQGHYLYHLSSLLPCFKFKVKGQGQGQGSRSNFWGPAIDIKGLALPGAAKSKEESLLVQGVCLCVE